MTEDELAFNREVWTDQRADQARAQAREALTFKQLQFTANARTEVDLETKANSFLVEHVDNPAEWVRTSLSIEQFEPEPGVILLRGEFVFMAETGSVPWLVP